MQAGYYYHKENSFLLLYSQHPDVCVAFPKLLREVARHVAQASYYLHGRKGISVYSLPASALSDLKGISFSRTLAYEALSKERREEILKTYGIEAEILKDAPKEVLDIIAKDVEVFALGVKPGYSFESKVKKVEKISPETEPKFFGEVKISALGKQDYVPACLIDISVDFFQGSCATLLWKGYYAPFSRCDYCYAKGQHRDMPLKRIKKANKNDLIKQILEIRVKRNEEEKETRFLRLGKNSEAGSLLTREQLLITLEACVETDLSIIFPTKFLEFNEEVADLLRRTDAGLLYSLGNDKLEEGAVEAGCTNEFRFEQAQKYFERGVKTGLYALIDGINFENPLFKANTEKALRLHKEKGIPVQFLPIRPTGRKHLTEVTGVPYNDLLVEGQKDIFKGSTPGGYSQMEIINIQPLELMKDFLSY